MESEHASDVLKGAFPAFQTRRPASVGEWEAGRAKLRERLRRLLGDWPDLFEPQPDVAARESHDGYILERLTYDNGIGDTVYGYLLIPERPGGRCPAVLYHHYHGGRYAQGKEEVITRVDLMPHGQVTGAELARRGYVVFCIDAYCFGERRFQGPAGQREEGRETETSLFKTFLWEGRTLWGMMVRDDLLALNYLASRPEVDPQRVAAMGMSMGSTRSWWAAALDDRIKAVVAVCCLTRYQNLIANGAVHEHGIYYYVPGVLKEGVDMESVIGLIAPRPLLTLSGALDGGSPADGVQAINDFQGHLYNLYGQPERFRGVLYEDVAHEYTATMWAETIEWLQRHL